MSQLNAAECARARALSRSVRFGLLLGVVIALGALLRASLPQIVEASQFALGKDPLGDVTLHVSNHALELTGPIVFGVTARVRDALADHPDITTVRLASPGGRVVEARDLRDLIRERGLTTIADSNCASACIVAFMAGRERLLAPGGSLGFHRYRSPDLGESEVEAAMAIDRRDLLAHGVPDWFLDRAAKTPNSGMWRPSVSELKLAHVLTGELRADGVIVPVRSARETIEAELLKSPLYTALRAHEPGVYDEVLDAMEQGARRGMAVDDIGARTRPLISQLAAKYVPAASDEAILKATAVAAETMRTLQLQSAESCYHYIQPATGPADLSALPSDLRERDVAATAAIIESGANGAPRESGPSTDADLRSVFGALLQQFGDSANVLDSLATPDVDRAAACGVVRALYERALSLPAPRNAQLLRYLLAGN